MRVTRRKMELKAATATSIETDFTGRHHLAETKPTAEEENAKCLESEIECSRIRVLRDGDHTRVQASCSTSGQQEWAP